MTHSPPAFRNTALLLLAAAGISALAFGLWGVERGIAASVGAGLSVLNWLALRWLTGRIIRSEGASKGSASLLLVLKIGVLIALVSILVQRIQLDPVGLTFGLGLLVIGPLLTGLVGGGRALSSHPAAEGIAAQPMSGAREER